MEKIVKSNATFVTNKEVQKKATAKAHTKENIKKQVASRKRNALIRNEMMEALKDILLTDDKKGTETFKVFLNAYVKEAIKRPSGGAGTQLASIIINEDTLKNIDDITLKQTTQNIDFLKFKIRDGCFKEQRDLIDDLKFYTKIIVMCGRRSGKTECNARIINEVALIPDSPIFYIGLTFESAINQMFDLVLECAEKCGNEVVHSSSSDGVIEFANGSVVYFKGNNTLHDQEKLRGYKARFVCDSCGAVHVAEL